MKKFWILTILLVTLGSLSAMDIWVSTTGSKNASGTKEDPISTVSMALRKAREARRLENPETKKGINIILKDGYYLEDETIWIRPEDSGTENSRTLVSSENPHGATIGGGIKLSNWRQKGKFWVTKVPEYQGNQPVFRQVWINGTKATKARDIVDFEKMFRILAVDKINETLIVPSKSIQKIKEIKQAEMVLHQMWAISNLRIKSITEKGDSAFIKFHQPESRIQFERPWPSPMIGEGVNSPFYLSNHPALLDVAGEWYYDRDSKELYYYPLPGQSIKNTTAIIPVTETLVSIEGTMDRPVGFVEFKDIVFSHTSWSRPSIKGHVPLQAGMYLLDGYKLRPQIDRKNNHKLDNQGWLGRPKAAVEINAANHIIFDNCLFTQIGSTALDFQEACSFSKIENSEFNDIGGNGIVLGSFSPKAHETHYPYNPSDYREMTHNIVVRNNLITNATNEDWGCVGIAAGYVHDVEICHNELTELSYMGISVGWGWNRNLVGMKSNLVKANHIHHYARHMYDVAGIYTLGAQPGTVIEENYIHSIYSPSYVHDPKHWFYIYTDEGSSYIQVKNNFTESEKYLQNAIGPGNIWTNNGPQVSDSIKTQAGRL